MADERINLHHLHYFWAVAHEGSLTRSAERLRVSQSAMSSQIRLLEDAVHELRDVQRELGVPCPRRHPLERRRLR